MTHNIYDASGRASTPPLKFTLIQSTGRPISKHLRIGADGWVEPVTTQANLCQGNFWTIEVADIDEYLKKLLGWHGDPNLVMLLGHHPTLMHGTITTGGSGFESETCLARTEKNFGWRAGEPGVIVLDFDIDIEGDDTPHKADALLVQHVPYLAQVRRVYKPSSSSHVLNHAGHWVNRKTKWHCHVAISDVSMAGAIGADIFTRTFDGGCGVVKLGNGTKRCDLYDYSLIDKNVFQGSREVFEFGGIIDPASGLSQPHKRYAMAFGDPAVPMLDVRTLPQLRTMDDWQKTSPVRKRLRAEKEPARLARNVELGAPDIAKLVEAGVTLADAERAVAEFQGDGEIIRLHHLFDLWTSHDMHFTPADVYADPAWRTASGVPCRDPMEPAYSKTAAKLYWGDGQHSGQAIIHSFAHGMGRKYLLGKDPATVLPQVTLPAGVAPFVATGNVVPFKAAGVPPPPPAPVQGGGVSAAASLGGSSGTQTATALQLQPVWQAPLPQIPLAPAAPSALLETVIWTQRQCEIMRDFPVRLQDRMAQQVTEQEAGGVRYTVAMHMFSEGRSAGEVQEMLAGTHLAQVSDLAREVGYLEKAFHRKKEQRALDADIGNEVSQNPIAAKLDLKDMLDGFVLLSVGGYVARRADGRVLPNGDIARELSASETLVPAPDGKDKRVKTFHMWLAHPDRVTVDTQTWAPHLPEFCLTPTRTAIGGSKAFNTWRGLPSYTPQEDYMARSQPFVDHMQYLCPVPAEFERQMQWLAHIVQKPGELPQTGYVHIATTHGIGRNWFASVLTRVLRGYVAANVELEKLLDGSFNGQLSRKLLMFCDEIHETGGAVRFKRAKALRQMITAEYRFINPKFDRDFTEYNLCRFLAFSNYEDAIAVDDGDRRFEFIENPSKLQSAAYYSHIYGLIHDPRFIDAVRQRLETWDISTFNAGGHARLNDVKTRNVEAVSTSEENALRNWLKDWPGRWVSSKQLKAEIMRVMGETDGEVMDERNFTYAMRRLGVVSTDKMLKFPAGTSRVSAITDRITRAAVDTTDTHTLGRWEQAWWDWYRSDRSQPRPTI